MQTRIEVTILSDGRVQVDENGQKSVITPQSNGFMFAMNINGDYSLTISDPKPEPAILPRVPLSSLSCFDGGLLFPEGGGNP